jgi:DNA integrity scanning protein DisA with diadenylate cyclase activity
MLAKQAIIRSAVDIAERIHASAILLPDSYTSERIGIETEIPVVVMPRQASDLLYRIIPNHVEKEEVVLHERIQEIAVAGYLKGAISGAVVGVIDGPSFDSIVVYDPRESYAVKSLQKREGLINSDAFRAVMKLALELALEGREGKHIGTAFIIGDVENVLRASHQLLLNPFKGHDQNDLIITDRGNWETFKEFAQLDGVFVISSRCGCQIGAHPAGSWRQTCSISRDHR